MSAERAIVPTSLVGLRLQDLVGDLQSPFVLLILIRFLFDETDSRIEGGHISKAQGFQRGHQQGYDQRAKQRRVDEVLLTG